MTNTGTTTLTGVHVTDNKVATVSCPDSTLAPGASETCIGSYTVTQADVDAGSVTNTAIGHATNPQAVAVASPSSSVTVQASLATSKLSVVEASSATTYHAAGVVIHYTFKVTNIGTTTLSGVHVTDNVATSLSCPSSSLAPTASETCTGSHTVTQADVHAGSITNTVVAHATNPHAVAVTSASSSVTAVAFGLRVTNASLPNGTRNVSYSQTQLTAAGGNAPYTFRLAVGDSSGLGAVGSRRAPGQADPRQVPTRSPSKCWTARIPRSRRRRSSPSSSPPERAARIGTRRSPSHPIDPDRALRQHQLMPFRPIRTKAPMRLTGSAPRLVAAGAVVMCSLLFVACSTAQDLVDHHGS